MGAENGRQAGMGWMEGRERNTRKTKREDLGYGMFNPTLTQGSIRALRGLGPTCGPSLPGSLHSPTPRPPTPRTFPVQALGDDAGGCEELRQARRPPARPHAPHPLVHAATPVIRRSKRPLLQG